MSSVSIDEPPSPAPNPVASSSSSSRPNHLEIYRANRQRLYPNVTDEQLNDEGDSPVTGIVHRYPDRCLFLVTSYCPLYCRYCTRKRKWVDEDGTTGQRRVEAMIKYVAEHPEIRDVIVSGGDPLSLSLNYL